MKLSPLTFNRDTVEEILNKPLKIEIGVINFENWEKGKVTKTVEGKLIKCNLASNFPHKPSDFLFQNITGEISEISIGCMVSIEIIEN